LINNKEIRKKILRFKRKKARTKKMSVLLEKHSCLKHMGLTVEEKLTHYLQEYDMAGHHYNPNGVAINHIKQNKELQAKVPMINDIKIFYRNFIKE